jgi:nifR3 family TIM-barrel protein
VDNICQAEKRGDSMIGLAPMDGITDAAFREIADLHGKPDFLVTEFVAVEGLVRGAVGLLHHFLKHETNTPTFGQIYGCELGSFYKCAILVCELGFDGVDINMGCPDKSVVKRGAGAGLIRNPQLAKDIIKEVKIAVKDWTNGQRLEDIGLPDKITREVNRIKPKNNHRKAIPVTVKTRIGYEKIMTKDWIPHIIEAQPARLALHGRTLVQMYSGNANWDEIQIANELAKQAKIPLIGNGDVKDYDQAQLQMKKYGVDGVLIGRSTFGNPWALRDYKPSNIERLVVALEHAKLFTKYFPDGNFLSLRKHLTWYTSNFNNASLLRKQLVQVKNVEDVKTTIANFLKENPLDFETDKDRKATLGEPL